MPSFTLLNHVRLKCARYQHIVTNVCSQRERKLVLETSQKHFKPIESTFYRQHIVFTRKQINSPYLEEKKIQINYNKLVYSWFVCHNLIHKVSVRCKHSKIFTVC